MARDELSRKRTQVERESKRTNRDVEKALKKHGPGEKALAEAIFGKGRR